MKLVRLPDWPVTLSAAAKKNIALWQELSKKSEYDFATVEQILLINHSSAMERVYISERVGYDQVIVLWSGMLLDKLLGGDIAGTNVFSYPQEHEKEFEKAYYHTLLSTPCGGILTRNTQGLQGRNISYETTQLPLCSAAGELKYYMGTGYDRLLSDTYFAGDENAVSREFSLVDIGFGTPEKLLGQGD